MTEKTPHYFEMVAKLNGPGFRVLEFARIDGCSRAKVYKDHKEGKLEIERRNGTGTSRGEAQPNAGGWSICCSTPLNEETPGWRAGRIIGRLPMVL